MVRAARLLASASSQRARGSRPTLGPRFRRARSSTPVEESIRLPLSHATGDLKRTRPLLAEHHLGRLDEHGHVVSLGEGHLLGAGARDRRDDRLTTDVDADLGHDRAELDALHLAEQLISGAEFHDSSLVSAADAPTPWRTRVLPRQTLPAHRHREPGSVQPWSRCAGPGYPST